MALGEVGMLLPWWCHALVRHAPGVEFNIVFEMQNAIVSEIFKVKVETQKKDKFHTVKLLKFKTFKFNLKYYFWNYWIVDS